MTRGARLILYCLLLIALMTWLVPYSVGRFGVARGMALVMAVYWFGFCLPFGMAFGAHRRVRFAGEPPVYAVALALPLMTLVAALVMPSAAMTPGLFALAIGAAAINGPVEEFFWRGAFLQTFPGRVGPLALGVVLFTGWHLPLSGANGVTYQGGPWALVAGAAALGTIWAWVAWRGRAVGWPMLSHALVNATVFPTLFAANAV